MMISAEEITRAEFDEVLARYPALIESISSSKTPSKGKNESTLDQLDKFRFEVAPERYFKLDELDEPDTPPTPLSHADFVQLVKWKLKHGTFRPNLLKQAESNSEENITDATKEAFMAYKKNAFSVTQAINRLTSLTGIGPATASLILAVHDPSKVVFFADELFIWVCHSGKEAQIKYNIKEYEELIKKSRVLIDRLGVDGRDIEQVGFVLVKEAASEAVAANLEEAKPNGDKARGRGRPKKDATKPAQKAEAKPKAKPKREQTKSVLTKEPTDMTVERKAQLQEIAARGRAAREAKKLAKVEKGAKFRKRVDDARDKKKSGAEAEAPTPKTGTKRKSDVTSKGILDSAKRVKKN